MNVSAGVIVVELGPAYPSNASAVAAWRRAIADWTLAIKRNVKYNDPLAESYYGSPSLRWAQTSYVQPQMHPYWYDRLSLDRSMPSGEQAPVRSLSRYSTCSWGSEQIHKSPSCQSI